MTIYQDIDLVSSGVWIVDTTSDWFITNFITVSKNTRVRTHIVLKFGKIGLTVTHNLLDLDNLVLSTGLIM